MGLILDTTELIRAERNGVTVNRLLDDLHEDNVLAISIISLAELSYGVRRAGTTKRRDVRQKFLNDVRNTFEILPASESVCLLAGELNADLELRGERLYMPDLIIAATALTVGFDLLTENFRHFDRIPGLTVIRPQTPFE